LEYSGVTAKRRVNYKRSKTIILVLLPALIFIGVIGWLISTTHTSHRQTNKSIDKTPQYIGDNNDSVTVIPAIYKKNQIQIKTAK